MNTKYKSFLTKKKKLLLAILSFLLILCLVGLSLWYLFYFRCKQPLKGFEFLQQFVETNTCNEKTFSFNALVYNITKDDSEITFDMNAFKQGTGESIFVEKVKIPFNDENSKVFSDIKMIMPISVTLKVQTHSDLFFFNTQNESNWNTKKIELTKEDYLKYIQELYRFTTQDVLADLLNNQDNTVLTSSSYTFLDDDNFETASIGYNDLSALNRAFVNLYGIQKDPTKAISSEENNFNLNSYLTSVSSYLKGEYEPDTEVEEESLLFKSTSFFGGCSLVKDILQNYTISSEDKSLLMNQFCNLGDLDELQTRISEFNKYNRYNAEDFLAHISHDSIAVDTEFTDLPINSYLPSDMLAMAELESNKTKDKIYNLVYSFTINKFMEDENIRFNNFCELYNSEYISKKYFNIDTNINEDHYQFLIASNIKKMIENMDKDISGGITCLLPEVENVLIEEFNNAILTKYLLLNMTTYNEFSGILNKGIFEINDNANMFKILTRIYEK